MFDDSLIMVRPQLVRKMQGDGNAALVLSVLHELSRLRRFENGAERWVRIPIAEMSERTGLTKDKAARALRKLVLQGHLSSRVRNDTPNDRTRSYLINMQS